MSVPLLNKLPFTIHVTSLCCVILRMLLLLMLLFVLIAVKFLEFVKPFCAVLPEIQKPERKVCQCLYRYGNVNA